MHCFVQDMFESLCKQKHHHYIQMYTYYRADSKFPVEGSADPPGGGGANIRFCQNFQNTAWNWENCMGLLYTKWRLCTSMRHWLSDITLLLCKGTDSGLLITNANVSSRKSISCAEKAVISTSSAKVHCTQSAAFHLNKLSNIDYVEWIAQIAVFSGPQLLHMELMIIMCDWLDILALILIKKNLRLVRTWIVISLILFYT